MGLQAHGRYESVMDELLGDRGLRTADRVLARLFSRAMVGSWACYGFDPLINMLR